MSRLNDVGAWLKDPRPAGTRIKKRICEPACVYDLGGVLDLNAVRAYLFKMDGVFKDDLPMSCIDKEITRGRVLHLDCGNAPATFSAPILREEKYIRIRARAGDYHAVLENYFPAR